MAKERANGEGSIRKRKDSRWEGRYTAGYDDTGKRIIKNVLGKTQTEMNQKLNAAIAVSQEINLTRSEDFTVAQWLNTWYELYAQPNIRLSTANCYELMIKNYAIPRVGRIKLTKLTTRDLQQSPIN